jgi:hypothetical protein
VRRATAENENRDARRQVDGDAGKERKTRDVKG